MIGTQPEGTIAGVVISAVSHEGLRVMVNGKPARLQTRQLVADTFEP